MSTMGSNHQRAHPLLVMFATLGVTAVVLFCLILGAAFWGFGSLGLSSNGKGGASRYLEGVSSQPFVAGIRLDGEINAEKVLKVLQKFDEAAEHNKVTGVLFEVNSPGGTVVPSQELFTSVKRVAAQKPVVVYVRDVAASGAFYAIAPASSIVANPASLVGSVGVVLSSVEAHQLLEQLKVKPMTLKTGALKDAGSPLREWNAADKAYLQKLIDDTRIQFASDVQTSRKLPDTAMTLLADGRVVLAREGLTLGLVDALGDRRTALERLQTLTGAKTLPKVIYMEEKRKINEELFLEFMSGTVQKFAQAAILGAVSTPQQDLRR